MHLNTGLTSTVNWGKRILTTEADLVTAHELGHNFGADHDDNTEQEFTRKTVCTPGQVIEFEGFRITFCEKYCMVSGVTA